MADPALKIVIAGGGLGGLAVAQGLRSRGLHCEVFERDGGPQAPDQGYRIHLDDDATAALRACLPPAVFERFIALSEPLGRGFGFFDEQLRSLAYFSDGPPDPPQAGGRAIDRSTLRKLLMTGLEPHVRLGAAIEGHASDAGGVTVQVRGRDPVRCDLLIGADGVGSAVARRLLPAQAPVDTGGVALIGRVQTTDEVLRCMPDRDFERLALVIGPDGVNLFLSQRLLSHRDADVIAARPELAPYLDRTPDASVWALVARAERLAPARSLLEQDPERLAAAARDAVAGWHPNMRRLIAMTAAADLTCTALRSADRLRRWPSQPRVTLLGDALHTMTPLQGQGASMAFRDVRDLCQLLAHTRPGAPAWPAALARHEARLVARARAAVVTSRRVYDLAVTEGWRRRAFKLGLRIGGRFARLGGTAPPNPTPH